jgi:sugar/nucleoside kinase (ribokinase family)
VLFLNREEAIKFVDFPIRPRLEEVMVKLQGYGPRMVVVTDGSAGASVYDGKDFYYIDSKKLQVVDSTGAGDAFAVGFLARLMRDDWRSDISPDSVHEALKWGIENSVSVIKSIGGQKGLLNKTEIGE